MNRRRVLRGMLAGSAIQVALPLLNSFLNDNGTALASGAPIPLRFGTWQWGLGMSKDGIVFLPRKTGANFDLPPEIEALKPIQEHINLFTSFDSFRDAAPNLCHHTGWVILRSGIAPRTSDERPGKTIDSIVAGEIGNSTRFRMLSATATGDVRDSYSYENGNSVNTPEWSPIRFYERLFGVGFQDPNAEDFKPDPHVIARRSVLSGVMDESRALIKAVGTEDRARLDQYFTGLRDLERRLEQRLTKPEPIAACHKANEPEDVQMGVDANLVSKRHRIMTDLMLMAVACDQTRVFNMFMSAPFAGTTEPGYDKPHHTATHEEPVDEELGYQPHCSWYTRRSMEEWAYFVQAMAQFKEGDGTMLDNVFVYATTDQSYAKIHSIEKIPMFSAGRAGGRVKTGLHIVGDGTPGTRLGYTAMRVMGLDIPYWGDQSNKTSKEIGEILV